MKNVNKDGLKIKTALSVLLSLFLCLVCPSLYPDNYTKLKTTHYNKYLHGHMLLISQIQFLKYNLCLLALLILLTCKCPKLESETLYLYSCVHYSPTEI